MKKKECEEHAKTTNKSLTLLNAKQTMIQYIVILLDDTSTSFCHYTNTKTDPKLMPLETLKEGIRYAMKENLNIQFVYPKYELPFEYIKAIESIDHTDIRPIDVAISSLDHNANVLVFNSLADTECCNFNKDVTYLIRTDKASLFGSGNTISKIIGKVARLNVVITDVETFSEDDFCRYKEFLSNLSEEIKHLYISGNTSQLNLMTDRMMLDKMNNCGAGDTTITLAPNGKFYVCPAFYYAKDGYAIGDVENGLNIKNKQLYRLDYAPICRKCDAYQCKRCVWLNRKTTLEVNTPSHEQCVVAHLERNASRRLLTDIRQVGAFLQGKEISIIDYLDPFEIKKTR